jgi:hypothetical protein
MREAVYALYILDGRAACFGWFALSVGGQCSGSDYIGMTCSDYKQTPIDMVATMSTCESADLFAYMRQGATVPIHMDSQLSWLGVYGRHS